MTPKGIIKDPSVKIGGRGRCRRHECDVKYNFWEEKYDRVKVKGADISNKYT